MGDYRVFSPRKLFQNNKFQKLLIAVFAFIILFFICSKGIIPEKYDFKEGDIAAFDIKAPRDFTNDAETQLNIEKALSGVSDYYDDRRVNIKVNAIDKITQYFNKAGEIKSSNYDIGTGWQKLQSETSIKLTKEDYIETLKLQDDQIKVLSDFLAKNLSVILSDGIRDKIIDDKKKAEENLNYYIRNDVTLNKSMKELASNIGVILIQPNMFYNQEKTEQYKNDIKRGIEPVIIKKNQNIVAKGQVITSEHLYLMRKAGLLQENVAADFTIYLGIAALIIIIEILIIIYIYRFKRNVYLNNSKLLIISVILCINAIFTTGGNVISIYLIPAGFVVILMSLIFDPLLAFVVSIPSTVIVACITNLNLEASILYLTGCMSGILFSYNAHQRNNVLIGGLSVGALNGAVIFSMGLINNNNLTQSLISSSIGVAGGILSSILAIGILPIFEQMPDIITPIKLLELSNPNQPLLKKMLFEAPGTYHHSILVGNLAETAANEIGANALLARAGSYYHDIGKIKRPYFFKENQITNDNPHDKITPKLSTLIITSHVKDGIELAREYKLPRAVKDIIEQHHGTTLVRYFYVMAMKDGDEMVEETSFRYEGPKPLSKEAAIVMLADSVEAGVRSLGTPTISDIEKMVEKIVQEKIDDGQLDNCDLTLKDMEKVKKAFLKVIGGIFHSRIEYPELNNQTKESE